MVEEIKYTQEKPTKPNKQESIKLVSNLLRNIFNPLIFWFVWAVSIFIIIIAIKDIEEGVKIFYEVSFSFFKIYTVYLLILLISYIVVLRRKRNK